MAKGTIGDYSRLEIGRDGAGPMRLVCGKIDGVNVVAEQAAVLMAFRARITRLYGKVRTQAGTAGYIVSLGKPGTLGYHGTITVPLAATAGTLVEGVIAQAIIDKDQVVLWSGDGGATATGDIDCIAIVEPAPA